MIFTAGATDALKLLAESFHWQAGTDKHGCQCRSCFCYLEENHTSVVGIRERAVNSGANIICVSENDITRGEQDLHLKMCNCTTITLETVLQKNIMSTTAIICLLFLQCAISQVPSILLNGFSNSARINIGKCSPLYQWYVFWMQHRL